MRRRPGRARAPRPGHLHELSGVTSPHQPIGRKFSGTEERSGGKADRIVEKDSLPLSLAFRGTRMWGALHQGADSWPEIAVTPGLGTRQQAVPLGWLTVGVCGSYRALTWGCHGQSKDWGGKRELRVGGLGRAPPELPLVSLLELNKPHALCRPTWSPSTSSARCWAGPRLMPCAPS